MGDSFDFRPMHRFKFRITLLFVMQLIILLFGTRNIDILLPNKFCFIHLRPVICPQLFFEKTFGSTIAVFLSSTSTGKLEILCFSLQFRITLLFVVQPVL